VLTELLVVKHSLLGTSKSLNDAAGVAFAALTAWALYLLMRTLRAGRVESGAAAALLLVFPWADSTRVWPTASMDTLAVALYLLGAVVAIRGLQAVSRRRAGWLAAASIALYLAAAWTYEVTIVAILLSVLLYVLAAPTRLALRRFALDAAIAAVALAVNLSGTTRKPRPLGDELHHARRIAGQAFSLLARALVPVDRPPGVIGAALLVVIGGAGVLVVRRRRELRRWLGLAGFGALTVTAGYVLYVPAEADYLPLAPGTVNRMNVLAAVGFALLAVGLVGLAAELLLRGPRRPLIAAGALWLAIGAGYVVQALHDESGWRRSASEQARILATIRRAVPSPARGLTIYAFNAPSYVAPGVPAFSLPFDLNQAVRLAYDDPALSAYPIRGLDVVQCAAGFLYPVGGTYGLPHRAAYGKAVFVDVPTNRAIAIGSRAACLEWRARLGAARA